MKIVLIIILMLFLIAVVISAQYYPVYRHNNTCRKLFEYFENGVLVEIHDMIENTEETKISRYFENACIDKLDGEISKFRKNNKYFIEDNIIKDHYRTYKVEIINHIMRRKNKIV